MKFLVRKAPENFIRTVNDEISSLLNRHFDSYFPEEIDTDKTEAKLEHGVLIIHAPKRYTEKDAKKKLTVK